MFIGHFAVGFAAKRAAPETSLGLLIGAPLFLDLIWPVFLLTGLEEVRIEPGNTAVTPLDFVYYPYSHSLLMAAVWATLLSFIYHRLTHYNRGAIVIWLGVVSHWFFDLIAHRPDLPLYPGGRMKFGLGLWNSPIWTLQIEGALFIAGVGVYFTQTRPVDRIGRFGLASFVSFLLIINIGNMTGPPPPNTQALALVALSLWIVVPWANWFDRHRLPINERDQPSRRGSTHAKKGERDARS
jgi:hypothetical protein